MGYEGDVVLEVLFEVGLEESDLRGYGGLGNAEGLSTPHSSQLQ
jgi:hypothetical protein